MKKVAVITLHAIKNYGSVLQTLATQKKFEELGCEVEIINYLREDSQDKNIYKRWTKGDNFLKRIVKSVILFPTAQKWKKVFWGFLNRNVNLTETTYLSEQELESNPPIADIYCTGSDQVWNSDWNNGFEYPFYLKFAPDGKKKIAFAASIGRNDFAEWEKPEAKKYLSQYSAISVRENNAVDILANLGVSAECVLDPTLCMTGTFWKEMAAPRMIKGGYVLIYQLNRNKKFDNYANEFARRHNLKLVRLCTRFDQIRLPADKHIIIPKVEEFISLFEYADFVITDSFHATAFSLNLNREIVAIYPDKFSSRLNSILEQTGMLHRRLTDFTNYSIADEKSDFNSVNKVLDEKRLATTDFLKRAVAD